MAYSNTQLFIGGKWRPAQSGRVLEVINPATEEVIGTVAHAGQADLDEALAAAAAGFKAWRAIAPFERCRIMRKAAAIMRERNEEIAPLLTMEQGKTLAEARIEAMLAADIIEWFAEEAKRSYGRVIPARGPGIYQLAIKEPVGPVAAFTPWNFPINQVVRKLSAALGAGCSIIVKAPEETPAAPAQLIRAFADAGVPDRDIPAVSCATYAAVLGQCMGEIGGLIGLPNEAGVAEIAQHEELVLTKRLLPIFPKVDAKQVFDSALILQIAGLEAAYSPGAKSRKA